LILVRGYRAFSDFWCNIFKSLREEKADGCAVIAAQEDAATPRRRSAGNAYENEK
jgi:hypothetical protein